MPDLQHIVRSIGDLTREEKLALRSAIDDQLQATAIEDQSRKPSDLIGLFSDEPDVLDRVMEAVYESRSRPLRFD